MDLPPEALKTRNLAHLNEIFPGKAVELSRARDGRDSMRDAVRSPRVARHSDVEFGECRGNGRNNIDIEMSGCRRTGREK